MKQYTKTTHTKCAVCGHQALNGKKLSEHVFSSHRLRSRQYTIQYLYGGVVPKCVACSNEPRYVAFQYKQYCVEHKHIAESTAGKKGGLAPAWNKGLTASSDARIAAQAAASTGVNNAFYGKKHSEATRQMIASSKRLAFDVVLGRIHDLQPDITVMSTADKYETNNSLLEVRCNVCGTLDEKSYFAFTRGWMCRTCRPIGSVQQLEIANFIRSILGCDRTSDRVVISTRNVIKPLELDIWVPEKKLAIEYHGLYWHSTDDAIIVDKKRHREKHLLCAQNGIKLLQIFSDEWRERRQICESMITNALGLNKIKLDARDCVVRRSTVAQTRPFLEDHHISGAVLARNHYVLVHQTEGLVGVLTLRKPNNMHKRYEGMFEVARMAFRHGTTVRGGASKLITAAGADVGSDCRGLLTYADLRFGTGHVYSTIGFKRLDDTNVNYWYTDGHSRIDRSQVRAENGVSEAEVAASRGLRQVWGCGNAVYVLDEAILKTLKRNIEEQPAVSVVKPLSVTVDVCLDDHACKECGHACINKRSVGIHVNKQHSMRLRDYVLKHFYSGLIPRCACGCGSEVTWHRTQNRFNTVVNGHNAYGRMK